MWDPPSWVLMQLAKDRTDSAKPSLYWMANSTEVSTTVFSKWQGISWMVFPVAVHVLDHAGDAAVEEVGAFYVALPLLEAPFGPEVYLEGPVEVGDLLEVGGQRVEVVVNHREYPAGPAGTTPVVPC